MWSNQCYHDTTTILYYWQFEQWLRGICVSSDHDALNHCVFCRGISGEVLVAVLLRYLMEAKERCTGLLEVLPELNMPMISASVIALLLQTIQAKQLKVMIIKDPYSAIVPSPRWVVAPSIRSSPYVCDNVCREISDIYTISEKVHSSGSKYRTTLELR